jgi:hypothetical protein
MARFYTNQANKHSTVSVPRRPTQVATKRPRSTNAEQLFAKDQKTQIRDAIKQRRDMSDSSSHTKEENLVLYRTVKSDAFLNLSASEKVKWEKLASEHNERIKQLPPIEHIFE